jgi:hypothetical protein
MWATFAILWIVLTGYVSWAHRSRHLILSNQEDCRALARAAVPPDPRPVGQWSDSELLEAWKTLKRREEECFEKQRVDTERDVEQATRRALQESLVVVLIPPLAALASGVFLVWGTRKFGSR